MKGRPNKPTALKALEGTLRPGRMHSEPRPRSSKYVPAPPARLAGRARAIWRRLAKDLHAAGLLTALDHDLLATYCGLLALAEEAEDHLRSEGAVIQVDVLGRTIPPEGIQGKDGKVVKTGRAQRSPWVVTLEHALSELRAIGGLLGLSPSSRGRLDVGEKAKDGKTGPEEDAFRRGQRIRDLVERRAAALRATRRDASG